jgi:methionyl-tRNA formyltransferase
MRIAFFGTPDFAARCLEKLLSSDHNIVGVVTAPDRPKGRGRKYQPSEVKTLAIDNNLDILQPENLKDVNFIESLRAWNADLFCVVAFRILPAEVFEIPSKGCINLHGSLLPKYRGAAPINWAIINGESETGLTTFFIKKKVDTGDIIDFHKIEIGPDETFGELYNRMADAGGDFLLNTVMKIESGDFTLRKQDDKLVSKAPKIYPDLGLIDWAKPVSEIHNLVRGLSPKPSAYSFLNNEKISILKTKVAELSKTSDIPGTVIQSDPKKGIIVACGTGVLEILELKAPSRKAVSGPEFVRGRMINVGDCFGGVE